MALLLATLPAYADLAKWDQARVTDLAQQLAKACDGWQKALIQQQPDQVGAGEARTGLKIMNRAQFLQQQSHSLAGALAKGDGYEKTKGLYMSLMEVVRDTEQDAQQMELDQPAQDAWAKVSGVLRQIAPYYNPKADATTG